MVQKAALDARPRCRICRHSRATDRRNRGLGSMGSTCATLGRPRRSDRLAAGCHPSSARVWAPQGPQGDPLMSPLPRPRRKISCAVSRGRLRHIAAAPTRQTTKTATKAMAIKNAHQSPCMPIMFSQYIATLSAVLFCGRLFLRAKWVAHSFNGVGNPPAGPLQPPTPFGHGERFQALCAMTSPEDSPTS